MPSAGGGMRFSASKFQRPPIGASASISSPVCRRISRQNHSIRSALRPAAQRSNSAGVQRNRVSSSNRRSKGSASSTSASIAGPSIPVRDFSGRWPGSASMPVAMTTVSNGGSRSARSRSTER